MNKYMFAAIMIMLFSSTSHADENIRDAKILLVGTQMAVDPGTDIFWIKLDKTMAPSSCQTTDLSVVVFDMEMAVSKGAMSIALVAYTTGKTVDIDTYDECISVWSTVRNLYFSPGQ